MIHWAGNGVPVDGMPSSIQQGWMTTQTELVYRTPENKLLISCVGIVTGQASAADDNPVNIRHRRIRADQFCHIAMTGKTQFCATISPQLPLVVATVRVVTKSAATQYQWPVGNLLGKPFLFLLMAG